jgi:putative ABC transport system permease protein
MAAVAVVMACGIAMFVTLRSMRDWLRDTQARYYEAYRFADVFAGARRAPAALERQLAAGPGVASVATRVVMDVTLDLPGLDEPGTGRLVSIPEQRRPALNDLVLQSGRWVLPGHPGEVVVSAAFGRANGLEPGDSIPAVLNGRWQRLRVVGLALSPEYIYEIRGLGDIFPDNRRFGVLWMGERDLKAAFRMEGAFNDVSIALAPGASEADVIDAADRLLAPYGGTGAYGRADHLSHMFVSSEIEETEVTSVLLPSIFLGVTAFLLNMVLVRLVATQREQIAILKAFGYGDAAVAVHYFQLALGPVIVGTVGGAGLGTWLAVALARVHARFYQFPTAAYTQDWNVVGAAFLVAGGAALVGAVGAVRRAVQLPAAERIVFRNIERRPLRALLAVVGIALATAIVMTGWFMFDAISVMKQIQFEAVQRHDVMVMFDVPRSAEAAWELTRIDGVRKVEPFRAVSARLRHGHLSKRAAILGLEPGSELQRLVDRDLAVREVPRGGLLVSDVLAGKLGVQAGDTVTVEVLEGKRPVRPVAVAAVSHDILGSSATMSLPALHAMLGEGGTLSGAYLAVDRRKAPAIYRALQETPAVSGVVVREAVVRGFEQTIAESFSISITMMVAFACVIAAGIVYNGARVALSERGRELASLRVLGFSRNEVSRLLLGEQALLTIVGMPLGLLLGYGLAWLVAFRFESDLFRIPLVIRQTTIAYRLAVVVGAALLSALAVRRRIRRLDLVAVLKTRE